MTWHGLEERERKKKKRNGRGGQDVETAPNSKRWNVAPIQGGLSLSVCAMWVSGVIHVLALIVFYFLCFLFLFFFLFFQY